MLNKEETKYNKEIVTVYYKKFRIVLFIPTIKI